MRDDVVCRLQLPSLPPPTTLVIYRGLLLIELGCRLQLEVTVNCAASWVEDDSTETERVRGREKKSKAQQKLSLKWKMRDR